MRRKDREISERAEMESILEGAQVCRIAMAERNEPYVVPVCFGYDNGSLYFHSAGEGKKMAILGKNPHCCVEVDMAEGPVRDESPCKWEMRYRSVICNGTAHIVDDYEKKKKALNCIITHYGAESYPFSEEELQSVCVIRIDIYEMTGKKYGF